MPASPLLEAVSGSESVADFIITAPTVMPHREDPFKLPRSYAEATRVCAAFSFASGC